ncbi:hypothetical protein [Methanogenium sp. MK-MG]|uniref:hypothetical protein n=1 Tax=Methanogenium sp. MK-MG TaxID=2599926 RepID=UPI001C2018A1|nr:hypothetical protein [Methanogenium sp. MK-MG]
MLILKNIDNRKQGRVWSIISMVTYPGSIIAFAVTGFLADTIFSIHFRNLTGFWLKQPVLLLAQGMARRWGRTPPD